MFTFIKLLNKRFSICPICGRKSSYSERFVYSILKQANINFIPQYEFEWLHNRFYDTYLPDFNAIIEIHGEQHYKPIKLNKGETPEETYKNTIIADKINTKLLLKIIYLILLLMLVSQKIYLNQLKIFWILLTFLIYQN